MGGFPAARITDQTAHGGLIVMGYPTVLIGNMPAARIGDMHTCPLVTVLVPHVGGPLVMGSFTVLVGNMPQSRVSDMLICVGPPDVVAMGCPNVMVGMAGAGGLLGMLKGLALAGLSVLKRLLGGGYPRAVLQPDGTYATQYNSYITIQGSPQYQATVVADLNTFLATPTGQRWAEAYSATGHNVTIRPVPAGQQQNNAFTQGEAGSTPNADGTPGPGSDSTITYNPSLTSGYTAADGTTQTMEPYQTLGHEMIHGLHNAQGNNLANNAQPSPFDNEEESQTIGVNGHDHDDITERNLEGGAGQSYRPDHDSITRDVYQDSGGHWHDTTTDASGNQTDTPIAAPVGGRPNH